MATSEQIKLLVKSYIEKDDERFRTTVLQIVAYEVKLGHTTFARELKDMLEKAVKTKSTIVNLDRQNAIFQIYYPQQRMSELVLSEKNRARLERIIHEYIQRDKLRKFGLDNRRKILIEGAPGTGKTMTASVIAYELSLPLYTVQMDKLISKFMGETGLKLRQIFESISSTTGVYFFDEFDAIGADRSYDNEVGEMRRVLNTFLQMIEQDTSDSVIIAATNNHRMLDAALFRRFDDVLHYDLPTIEEIALLMKNRLEGSQNHIIIDQSLLNAAVGLSQSEIVHVCDDVLKRTILNDMPINNQHFLDMLKERHSMYKGREA